MISLYKKYVNYIVGILFALLCGKSCQKCTAERQLDWQSHEYENLLDSIYNINDSLKYDVKRLNDSIIYFKYELNKVKSEAEKLQDLNMYFRRTNSRLIEKNMNE